MTIKKVPTAAPSILMTFPTHVHRSQQNIARGTVHILGILLYKRHHHTCNFREARVVRYAFVEPERRLCNCASEKIALLSFFRAICEPFAGGVIFCPTLKDATILRDPVHPVIPITREPGRMNFEKCESV